MEVESVGKIKMEEQEVEAEKEGREEVEEGDGERVFYRHLRTPH